jgi:nitrogen regulatory protein PII 2
MKEVLAVVRMNKIGITKKALGAAGFFSLTAHNALGRGKGLVDFKVLKGAEKGYEEAISQLGQSQRLVPKRVLSLVVVDEMVDDAVNAIISANKTGKSGDGKIFVLPVSDAIRVRTAESGDDVLDEAV